MEHKFNVDLAVKYGVYEAIFISNLTFWLTKNASSGRHLFEVDNKLYPELDGQLRYWTCNSVSEYSALFPYLSTKQIRGVIENLLKHGVIIKGYHSPNKYDRASWYALVDETPIGVIQKRQNDLPNQAIPFAQSGNSICPQGQMYTDKNKDKNTAATDEKKDSSSSIENSNKKYIGLYEAFDIMTGSIKKDSEQVLKKIIQLSSCGFPFEKDTGDIELLLSEPTYTDEKSWQFWYERYFQKVNKGSKTRAEWWRTVSQAIDSARQSKFYKLTTQTQKANDTTQSTQPKPKKIYGC